MSKITDIRLRKIYNWLLRIYFEPNDEFDDPGINVNNIKSGCISESQIQYIMNANIPEYKDNAYPDASVDSSINIGNIEFSVIISSPLKEYILGVELFDKYDEAKNPIYGLHNVYDDASNGSYLNTGFKEMYIETEYPMDGSIYDVSTNINAYVYSSKVNKMGVNIRIRTVNNIIETFVPIYNFTDQDDIHTKFICDIYRVDGESVYAKIYFWNNADFIYETSPEDNPEFKSVILDRDGRILWGRYKDNTTTQIDLSGYKIDGIFVDAIVKSIITENRL
jgi:hypothetical protein